MTTVLNLNPNLVTFNEKMPVICESEGCDVVARCKENVRGSPFRFCRNHALPGMKCVTMMQCQEIGCGKCPYFNYEGNKSGSHCNDHKLSGMINVKNKKCKGVGCSKRPYYNYAGITSPIYCSEHKLENMINVNSKKCKHIGCYKRPHYGIDGLKSGDYCVEHKLGGMVNVTNRKCAEKDCDTNPSFNYSGTKQGLYCSKHKLSDMVDVVGTVCRQNGCTTSPHFNYEGVAPGIYCSIHKLPEMIDVSNRRCVNEDCKVNPHYNYEGETIRLYCASHKLPGMINITDKHCESEGCQIRACYNYEGIKPGVYCVNHKFPDMVDVVGTRCKHDGCDVRATFNHRGAGKFLYCGTHRLPGMVNIMGRRCEEENCETQLGYGYLFQPLTRCAKHRLQNMYFRSEINPICLSLECTNEAYYCEVNESYPTKCELHASEVDVKIVFKTCSKCDIELYILENHVDCDGCRGYNQPVVRNAKEYRIKEILLENGLEYEYYDTKPPHFFSRYRPDFVFECRQFNIILEVDEHQHRNYANEKFRMIEICQDYQGIPVLFIRYNPDDYKNHLGEQIRGKKENIDREAQLVNLIRQLKHMDMTENCNLQSSVCYLYYDGYAIASDWSRLEEEEETIEIVISCGGK